MNENKKKNGAETPKWGRHPRESRKSHCVMVRFDDGEWLRFLAMHGKSGVEARAVFLKAHFFGQPFRVLVTDIGEEGDGVALQAGAMHEGTGRNHAAGR